jgi:hypothetical protein
MLAVIEKVNSVSMQYSPGAKRLSTVSVNGQRWLRRFAPMNYDQVHKALRQGDAYGGLAYFHLLLKP